MSEEIIYEDKNIIINNTMIASNKTTYNLKDITDIRIESSTLRILPMEYFILIVIILYLSIFACLSIMNLSSSELKKDNTPFLFFLPMAITVVLTSLKYSIYQLEVKVDDNFETLITSKDKKYISFLREILYDEYAKVKNN